jgi:hypothetical protein
MFPSFYRLRGALKRTEGKLHGCLLRLGFIVVVPPVAYNDSNVHRARRMRSREY